MRMCFKTRYIMALDCGSTNIKAAVFDQNLRRLGEHAAPVSYTAHGARRVEFDAAALWRSTSALIRRVCAQAGLPCSDISAMALTGQAGTFCALDAVGRPLTPFMSWQDQRALTEAEWLNRRLGADIHHHCSWPRLIPGNQAAMLLWLGRHKPAMIKKASAFVTVSGFLGLRLGFPNAVDANMAAMSGLYSLERNDWWKESLDLCGVDRPRLPAVVPLGHKLEVTAFCPNPILPNLTGMVLAGNDQTAGAFGNFCLRANMVVTLGTALVVYRAMGRRQGPYTAEGCWGPYPGGGYYELVTRNHGCAALDWACTRLAPGRDMRFFTTLAQKALRCRQASADCAAEALFYPDAMNTARAWIGRPEPGARALAVFEGIGFALKQLIEDDLGVCAPMSDIYMTGGGSVNTFWLQLLADILNARVARGTGDALLGAARQACPRAMPRLNSVSAIFLPRDTADYLMRYARWKQFGKWRKK